MLDIGYSATTDENDETAQPEETAESSTEDATVVTSASTASDNSVDVDEVVNSAYINDLGETNYAALTRAVEEANPIGIQAEHTSEAPRVVSDSIPENSESLSVKENTSRFSSAIWFEEAKNQTILLAGLGGIGSYTAFLLSRLQPRQLRLYDNDEVDASNTSGQLYSSSSIGTKKVSAIDNFIKTYSSYYRSDLFSSMFDGNTPSSDIMICGFDSMQSRKTFFNSWRARVDIIYESNRKDCLFIDGRLSAEEFQIFCIKGDDEYNINRYAKEFLFSDSEAEATICSYKQTSFCANMIASYIVNLFINFCANKCHPLVLRDLPFITEYNAETILLKTEN